MALLDEQLFPSAGEHENPGKSVPFERGTLTIASHVVIIFDVFDATVLFAATTVMHTSYDFFTYH